MSEETLTPENDELQNEVEETPEVEEMGPYDPLLEAVLEIQFAASLNNDRVGAVFVQKPTTEIREALASLPTWVSRKTRLQSVLNRVVEQTGKDSDIDFEALPDEQIKAFLENITQGLRLETSPEGWPDLQILTVGQLSQLAGDAMIQKFFIDNKVSEVMARAEVSEDYRPSKAMLEQAILSAQMTLALLEANAGKKKLVTAGGGLFAPPGIR